MTRIVTNAVRSLTSSQSPASALPAATPRPRAIDTVVAPAKAPTASQKFAELKASIPVELSGHGSDGEPFFTLGSFQPKASEAALLTALAPKLYSKRSETADRHDLLPATGDEALRSFASRAASLRDQVPEESAKAFDDAVAKTQQLFFNKALFDEIRLADTSTHGPQYGRDALTLLAKAKTGHWFFVALQIVG